MFYVEHRYRHPRDTVVGLFACAAGQSTATANRKRQKRIHCKPPLQAATATWPAPRCRSTRVFRPGNMAQQANTR